MSRRILYEQRVELDRAILWLSDKGKGSAFTPYRMKRETGLHGQTAKRVLETIYLCQQFAPPLDIDFCDGKTQVRVDDLAPHLKAAIPPVSLVLVKMYLVNAFDRRSARSVDFLDDLERALVEDLVLKRLVGKDGNLYYLTPSGFSKAIAAIESAARVRDECLFDLGRGIKAKRELEASVMNERRSLDDLRNAVYTAQEQVDRLAETDPTRFWKEMKLNEEARSILIQWSSIEKEFVDLSAAVSRIRGNLDRLSTARESPVPEFNTRRREARARG
jgi:hypothetical protein